MAKEPEDETEIDEEAEEGAAPPKKRGGLKKLLIILIPLIALLGGGAALYFGGMLDSLLGHSKSSPSAEAPPPPPPPVDYDLPVMVVNLNSPADHPLFLRIRVSLEVPNPLDVPKLELVLPRILDTMQVYLRELRLDDLRGSASLLRMREELLDRLNDLLKPIKITDVLFKDMLVQ
jgi:flagellar FliL protein